MRILFAYIKLIISAHLLLLVGFFPLSEYVLIV